MINLDKIIKFSIWVFLAGFLVTGAGPVIGAESAPGGDKVTINFKDVEIGTVISSVARITGRTFIVDPRVKGKVTIIASEDVSEDELYSVFLSILQVHEFAAVEDGGIVKIVPLSRVKHDSSIVDVDGDPVGNRPADSVLTRIVKLEHVPVDKLIAILRPLVPAKSYLAAQVESNMLLISDRAANIERLMKIVKQIDQPGSGEIEIIKLEHADARDVVQVIEGLSDKARAQSANRQDMRLISDSRTNSILLSGADDEVLRARTLASYLDTPIESSGATQVVFLRYAKAKDLLPILRGGDFGEGDQQKSQKTAAAPAGPLRKIDLNVQADDMTNALIITASPAVTQNILAVVRKLDIRRPQVMIEAVIAEVATGAGAELGVQWRATDVTSGSDRGVVGGTAFSGPAVPNINILSSGDLTALGISSGLNIGYLNGAASILGVKGLNLGMLVSALSSDSDTNILSTPSLVTMDNKEAEIIVGQNVPFSTGSYTGTGSETPTNPFTTYERRDVGLKLKVLPQINEGDTIRLDIEQEVSNLSSAGGSTQVGLQTTSTREIRTSVMVDDGRILVLGGLISDDIQETEERVPVLGSIPLLGWLFRYNKTSHNKRNLMVFLRPTILRDTAANNRITFDKYDYMRRVQQEFKDDGLALMPDAQVPLLPEEEL
ncbi:MAG: type II secretion system secretin GspD [Desulfurivibrionaceae bacterium]|nr:type II secretion system secretin GspD [Desulfurivibrionaceae bacterium]